MKIISKQGDPSLAEVFVAEFRNDDEYMAEFVDAHDPALSKSDKWVMILSTQFGCPVSCAMCDAGSDYMGDLSAEEIFSQIEFLKNSNPELPLHSVKKLKIQFARMGEPALNPDVLSVVNELPRRYDMPGLIPCIATTAPSSSEGWFERLLSIRHGIYRSRDFQLQFSINSTDENVRDELMPVRKMPLAWISNYSRFFYEEGRRKVSLNFALTEGVPVDPKIISKHFDPEFACIKITPLNPTIRSSETGFVTALSPNAPEKAEKLCNAFRNSGFDVILSIGDERENSIGSNCGMAVRKLRGEQ